MDSHSFRLIAAEWLHLLSGARVEKIHGPLPSVTAFSFFAHGHKFRCILRSERQEPLFFLTNHSLENPDRPEAQIMRLRKYVGGRRLGAGCVDFCARALAFPLQHEGEEVWLLLSLREGARIVPALPEDFGASPAWPLDSLVAQLCDKPWRKSVKTIVSSSAPSSSESKAAAPQDAAEPWQAYSIFTPLLRETLAGLDIQEGRALVVDLEAGNGDLFLYANAQGTPTFYSAWPLPDSMLLQRGLMPITHGDATAAATHAYPHLAPHFPLICQASVVDASRFFTGVSAAVQHAQVQPERKDEKRTARLLVKLAQEEERLRGLLALRAQACLIQENLWKYSADVRLPEITVAVDNQECHIVLDSLVSVRENMRRMFHQSDRGARGLAILAERRNAIKRETAGHVAGEFVAQKNGTAGKKRELLSSPKTPADAGMRTKPISAAKAKESTAHKNTARFVSSNGYTLIRGKNAAGNHALLKIGSPYDLWLHAKDGPSAHLIIRRAHAADEVPEQTLQEAATLVGMKSWQRNDFRGEVMVALLKDVHPIKGAAAGTVRVDTLLQSVRWQRAADVNLEIALLS